MVFAMARAIEAQVDRFPLPVDSKIADRRKFRLLDDRRRLGGCKIGARSIEGQRGVVGYRLATPRRKQRLNRSIRYHRPFRRVRHDQISSKEL